MVSTTRLDAVLRDCVREHDWSVPPASLSSVVAPEDWSRLVVLATRHRVLGCLRRSATDVPQLPASAREAMERGHRRSVGRQLAVLSALRDLHARLAQADLPWLVLKGPVLAFAVYRRPDLRSYGDLDILVPPTALPDTLQVMEDCGFTVLDRNWRLMRAKVLGQMLLGRRGGGLVDVHWHLLWDAQIRASFHVPMQSLFDRAREVRVGNVSVRTLDAVDTCIYLAVHSCLEGGDLLVWVKDLEQAVYNGGPGWDDIVARSRQWGAGPLVGTMLARARATLMLPVPARVLAELVPNRAWRGALRAADRLFPVTRSVGRGSPATLLARSTRGEWSPTLANAVSGVGERLKIVLRRRSLERPDEDVTDPRSLLYPSGGQPDRAAYLAEIANEGWGAS